MPRRKFPRVPKRIVELVEDLRKKEDRLALALSLVIGALVGLVVVAFILLTGRLTAHVYPAGGPGWRRLVAPIIGSLIAGYLLFRYFPLSRGSGIPQTRAAVFIHDGRISLRSVIGKFITTAVTLASGIPLGREGPSVYIGAGLASSIGRRLGLSKNQIRRLLPVGGAAALSAAFNTPIAAVLFTLEEIMGDLHAPVLGSVVIASATAWMVLHLVLGDNPLFQVSGYHLVSPYELLIYALLGIVGGFVAVGFVKLLLWLRGRFLRFPAATLWLQPLAGGLTVGAIGFFVPQVMGVGYDQIERVLNGDVILKTVLLLGALKIVSTSMAYASGNAGGIFGPSLFIGAMVGASVGGVAHYVFPASTAGPGAYALVGMGAAFAGVIRAPLTSVIMIFEVTRDYAIIVPLMIANLIAYYISHRLQHENVYESLALQDGLHLPAGAFRARNGLWVTAALRDAPQPLTPEMKVDEATMRIGDSDIESWPVVDESGLIGMVRVNDVVDAATGNQRPVTIATIMKRAAALVRDGGGDFPHVHSDQPLGLALARMGDTGHNALPVVSRGNAREMVGIVTLVDVLKAYGVDTRRMTPVRGTPAVK
ncbi:MAG TPA: chloride channel protein [Gemmatimonadaceae bacterium]|nr:chloride channel protein [Gemmatimonadaceae bacterium]